jgi:hypothetical protein
MLEKHLQPTVTDNCHKVNKEIAMQCRIGVFVHFISIIYILNTVMFHLDYNHPHCSFIVRHWWIAPAV